MGRKSPQRSLKGDMIVGRIAHQLRAAMGALVEGLGSYRNLAALGITTSSYDKGGILHVDGIACGRR